MSLRARTIALTVRSLGPRVRFAVQALHELSSGPLIPEAAGPLLKDVLQVWVSSEFCFAQVAIFVRVQLVEHQLAHLGPHIIVSTDW